MIADRVAKPSTRRTWCTRAPVVTVMGHVDHGKTTLLDSIRETRVAEREAGGITQHIGAYLVPRRRSGRQAIVFLDTPGHAAFTLMRARGARSPTSWSSSSRPTTASCRRPGKRSITPRRPDVPIIVAVNKIDKPGANPETVKRQLADLGLMPEDWGGDDRLRRSLGEAEEEPRHAARDDSARHRNRRAQGEPEARARSAPCSRRSSIAAAARSPPCSCRTARSASATTSSPARWSAGPRADRRSRPHGQARGAVDAGRSCSASRRCPQPGDSFQSVADPAKARQIATFRQAQAKEKALGAKGGRLTLESLQQQMSRRRHEGAADHHQGRRAGLGRSAGRHARRSSPTTRRKIKIIHSAVGAINESDVLLATASNAIIIGFNVRPDRNAADVAEREKVDIRHHSVIYNVTDEIKKAMTGLLEPTFKEVRLGSAAGPRDVQGAEGRHDCRLHGQRRPHHAPGRRPGPPAARQRRRLGRQARLAQALQGRRVRGASPASSAAWACRTSTTSRLAT